MITWTYNGESTADNGDTKTDYYIKGAKITGWEDVYTDETRFTEENGIYTLTVDLEEGDEFIFTSMVTVGETSGVGTEYIRYSNIAADDLKSQSFVTGTDSANLVASQAGTYTFTYDASTKVCTECGARLPKEAVFCTRCGARQTDQTEQQEEEMTVEEQPETEEDGNDML